MIFLMKLNSEKESFEISAPNIKEAHKTAKIIINSFNIPTATYNLTKKVLHDKINNHS